MSTQTFPSLQKNSQFTYLGALGVMDYFKRRNSETVYRTYNLPTFQHYPDLWNQVGAQYEDPKS